jgi:transcriptional regulator with XRE-family HTH domain
MKNTLLSERMGKELKGYFKRQKMSQVEVAKRYGVHQSWIARIYSGQFSRGSSVLQRMCEDARISLGYHELEQKHAGIDQGEYKLLDLLSDIWEGTAEDAEFLIEALQMLRKIKQKNLAAVKSK